MFSRNTVGTAQIGGSVGGVRISGPISGGQASGGAAVGGSEEIINMTHEEQSRIIQSLSNNDGVSEKEFNDLVDIIHLNLEFQKNIIDTAILMVTDKDPKARADHKTKFCKLVGIFSKSSPDRKVHAQRTNFLTSGLRNYFNVAKMIQPGNEKISINPDNLKSYYSCNTTIDSGVSNSSMSSHMGTSYLNTDGVQFAYNTAATTKVVPPVATMAPTTAPTALATVPTTTVVSRDDMIKQQPNMKVPTHQQQHASHGLFNQSPRPLPIAPIVSNHPMLSTTPIFGVPITQPSIVAVPTTVVTPSVTMSPVTMSPVAVTPSVATPPSTVATPTDNLAGSFRDIII